MGLVDGDDGWRMPAWLWERIEALLPDRPAHPLGCHYPRVPDRVAMDAILLVLRTGMQWKALNATGICHPHDGAPPEGSGRRTRWGNCWVVVVLIVELPCLGGRPVQLPASRPGLWISSFR
jgi:hypothetical protein